ncbi:hypothetical protein [Actinomadura alba]|uniref:Uncharacterized protein n=1 Tax=Actinomadura alba TaxID=406431 RepID=A0ABR7LYZ9_9ACTN|nr:hypothetical protein [Actinomadura alba]MBC6469705.1 hypothetical protein [Actinomadura alba]
MHEAIADIFAGNIDDDWSVGEDTPPRTPCAICRIQNPTVFCAAFTATPVDRSLAGGG